jgi:hypothetical protein
MNIFLLEEKREKKWLRLHVMNRSRIIIGAPRKSGFQRNDAPFLTGENAIIIDRYVVHAESSSFITKGRNH